jgi:leader peptidase (prepilin peptidase) / N-methyltransferase
MTTPLFQPALAGIMLLPAAAAAVPDWRAHRVPNLLVAVALVPVLVAVLLVQDRIHLLASVGSGVAVMATPLLVLHLVTPAAMGFGDVKLAAALGAALGVVDPSLGLPALAVAAGLTLLAAAWSRRPALPFAPGLVTGAAAALALGAVGGWRTAA